MTPYQALQEAIQKTEVIRQPRQQLATFGQTEIEYFLISELAQFPDRCRLRHGDMVAKKPRIITPDNMLERFEGFGTEGKKYGDWFLKNLGDELRGLQYKFINQLKNTRLEHSNPKAVIERISRDHDPNIETRIAILKGPEEIWHLSLLKFIVEISSKSFRGNVQELEERGFFDPGSRIEARRRAEIETLFKNAHSDRSQLPILGRKLKEYGLFEQFQDRFFDLIKP
jgi:hypothetical protein